MLGQSLKDHDPLDPKKGGNHFIRQECGQCDKFAQNVRLDSLPPRCPNDDCQYEKSILRACLTCAGKDPRHPDELKREGLDPKKAKAHMGELTEEEAAWFGILSPAARAQRGIDDYSEDEVDRFGGYLVAQGWV